MIDSATDLTEELLKNAPRLGVPLSEIAHHLNIGAEALERQLERDARFLLLPTGTFPDLSLLPAKERDAYAAALRAAGLHGTPRVLLADPAAPAPGSSIEVLLRDSVGRLLTRSPDPALAAAADQIEEVLRRFTPPPPEPDRTGPSTSPPPAQTGSERVPPRRRIPSPPRPRYPGSRRG